jgi:RNA polymerase sigma-70 factor (ECF subfamily)
MPRFRYDPALRFRAWLWTVLLNKWRDRVRQLVAQPALVGIDELKKVAVPDNVGEVGEQEYRSYLFTRAIELMQAELPDVEWRASRGYVVEGRPAPEVAEELGLSVNQVYLAKTRILRLLRAELEGFLD